MNELLSLTSKLDDEIRVTCLLKLVPERMAGDVLKQQANWKYQALRDHLLTLQHSKRRIKFVLAAKTKLNH